MRTGRPKASLVVSAEQRDVLESWSRRRTTAQGLALRARIILICAETDHNGEIAERLNVTRQTVGRWSSVDGQNRPLVDTSKPAIK
jgi:transposase